MYNFSVGKTAGHWLKRTSGDARICAVDDKDYIYIYIFGELVRVIISRDNTIE